MANRDLSNYRSSIQQTPYQEGVEVNKGAETAARANAGQQLIRMNQEAKINENFSRAQIELNALERQYQVDYESNPFDEKGLSDLKQKRTEILSTLGDEISPIFRHQWNTNATQLELKQDGTVEAWGFQQTRVNTVKSINQSIKNNMSQAALDGQAYGNSDSNDFSAMLNYKTSADQLLSFGKKTLGDTKSSELMETYSDDYIKTFVSGVAETNPLKALRLMDDPSIKAGFKDENQYSKMKEAVNNRAMNIGKIKAEQEVLSTLKDENSILTKSLTQPLSYADLQQEFSRTKMSPEAQKFFMRANGYTKEDGTRNLEPGEQLKAKAQLYTELTQLTSKDDMTTQEISAFQEKIYQNMNNGTLNEKEGAKYLNDLLTPFVNQKEENLKNFSTGFIDGNIGLAGLQKMYDQELYVGPEKGFFGRGEEGPITQATNDANKVKLYDYYMTALEAGVKSYGIGLADIQGLDKVEKRKLFSSAQSEAKRLYLEDNHPALSTLNDTPNQIFSGGKLIQGMAGSRNIKPDVTAPKSFELQVGSDGYLYRLYPDGMRERAGKAPEGVKY